MNPRERTLLTVLFVLIGVLGTAAVFYFFFYQEYADLSSQVAADSEKLAEKKKALKEAEDERDRLLTTNPHLKDWQQLSLSYLPPTKNGAKHSLEETNKHIADVQRRYQDNLESLLKRHHFTGQGGGEVDVKPANWDFKTPDGKGGGLAAKDKVPVYTRLPYVVTASATYANIVEMLKDFYNEPLLQEVRLISIKKSETRQPELTPPSGGRGAAPGVVGRGGPDGAAPGGVGRGGPGGVGRGGPGGIGRGAAPAVVGDDALDAAPDDVPEVVPGRGGPGRGGPGAAGPGVGAPGVGGPGGQRPGRGGQGGRNDASIPLDVKMTVEVLMVTGAEYRTALLPSKIKPGEEAVLARPGRDYSLDMPARDPFNGKPLARLEPTRRPETKADLRPSAGLQRNSC